MYVKTVVAVLSAHSYIIPGGGGGGGGIYRSMYRVHGRAGRCVDIV